MAYRVGFLTWGIAMPPEREKSDDPF
ncbi:hypothetical protein MCP1_40191 [Candidatus Terasakiella magnetica]|nr:hypothetical protein MCP1_40191 [Candidatus Terasakiella magnetica]